MIAFTVPGRPVPKKRPRLGVHGRRAYIYTPPETVAYEQTVGWMARVACREPLQGPIEVRIIVSFSGRRSEPDLDNCIKSILDGCNRIAFSDDRQVVRIVAEAHQVETQDEERAEVEIREYREESA
jgi:Holliday junction resolvase RusA-like endonuclease